MVLDKTHARHIQDQFFNWSSTQHMPLFGMVQYGTNNSRSMVHKPWCGTGKIPYCKTEDRGCSVTTLLRYPTSTHHSSGDMWAPAMTLVPTPASVVVKKHWDTQHQQGLYGTVEWYNTIWYISYTPLTDPDQEPPFTPLVRAWWCG